MILRSITVVLTLLGTATIASAIEITEDTYIACDDLFYDGQDIVIDGCIVTIDCEHHFNNIQIINGGQLTHSTNPSESLYLTIAGDVIVEEDAFIDVTGRGYPAMQGPGAGGSSGWPSNGGGGGSHGGVGGTGNGGNLGGPVYGSATAPVMLGSGGGDAPYGGPGSGGGAIRLVVEEALIIDGEIRADGTDGSTGGGGSGGSIWITASEVSGNGIISANGGQATHTGKGAGGGGGRIAIYVESTWTFAGTHQAFGGSGTSTDGGCGTVYLTMPSHPNGLLLISNGGNSDNMGAAFNDQNLIDGDLHLINGGRLRHDSASESGMKLVIEGNVLIDSNGRIDVTGLGYPGTEGPGAGGSSGWPSNGGGGGSHGGVGGTGNGGNHGGPVYDSATAPAMLGSGGGQAPYGWPGNGGGAIRLVVEGALIIDGEIRADGTDGTTGGGGSGGSIWITASEVSGNGIISANGGQATHTGKGGGGGGGRIAIYACDSMLFNEENITVEGGTGLQYGEAGTIFITDDCEISSTVTSSNECWVYNNPISGTPAEQIDRINQSPPLFVGHEEEWTLVQDYDPPHEPWEIGFRKHDMHDHNASFECYEDALEEAFVSTLEYLPGADEVTYDNCQSAFYRFTFMLPDSFSAPNLEGRANVDDIAVLWLNGERVTLEVQVDWLGEDHSNNGFVALTWPTPDEVEFGNAEIFQPGLNELTFSVVGDLSVYEPTGLEFDFTVSYTIPCPADTNSDGTVDINDIFRVLGLWGACDDPCPPYCTGDLTEDCMVNIDDIFSLLEQWGPCE